MLPAVRTPGQGVVKSVEEKSVVTVSAGHSAHPGNIGQRGRGGRRRGQVDDPLAVRSRTGDPLAGALADEEAVAGAPHVLPAWGSVPDGGRLVAQTTLDNVLRRDKVTHSPLAGWGSPGLSSRRCRSCCCRPYSSPSEHRQPQSCREAGARRARWATPSWPCWRGSRSSWR